jgi:hypothetical protein
MTGIVSGRDIPDPIRRAVRQRCKFGCVVCGMPIYHYDHIQQFAEVREHKEDNLVLLCPNHHQEKTSRRLSADRIQHLRDTPYNSTRETASGYRFEPNKTLDVILGTNKARCEFRHGDGDYVVLQVEFERMFQVHCRDGWISYSFKLTDYHGNIILEVNDGEMVVSTEVWDYQYEGTRLTVRSAKRKIVLDLNLSNQLVHIHTGAFLLPTPEGALVENGYFFHVKHKELIFAIRQSEAGYSSKGDFLLVNDYTFKRKMGHDYGKEWSAVLQVVNEKWPD